MLHTSAVRYFSYEHPIPKRLSDPSVRFVKNPAEADVVVFHPPILYSLPANKPAGQLWAALSIESESQYPILARPEFMSNFDLTMTYRRDSDVWLPYVTPDTPRKLLKAPKSKTEEAQAVYMASYAWPTNRRNDYVEELMKYIPVDSYGKCLHNRDLPEDAGMKTKLSTIARYRFTLAFENSNCVDYVTEKFFQPLEAGSVPVYMGAPNVAEFAPGDHCYIDVSKFKSPRELAAYLIRLSADEQKYRKYFDWKRKPLRRRFLKMAKCVETDLFSRLADVARKIRPRSRTSGKCIFPGLPTRLPGIRVKREKDGSLVAHNPAIQRDHVINNTAAFILELCDGRHCVADLAAKVQHVFHLKSPPVADVEGWLWYAVNDGLIYPLCTD